MSLQIEKDVPLPPKVAEKWRKLAVGDSVFIPGKTSAQIGGSISHARVTTGYRLVCRTVTKDGTIGVRVWRVE